MPDLLEHARRRLEPAAAEMPTSTRAHFFRRQAISWGVVAVTSLLLVASIVMSVSVASAKSDEIADLQHQWALQLGRAEASEEAQAAAERRVAALEEQSDRAAKMRRTSIGQIFVLRQIENHVDAGGGDEATRQLIGEAKRRRAEARNE